MAKSDYLEQKVLNLVLRGIAFTPPAGAYLALFSTATTDAGGGTELVGNGYLRQAVTFAAPSGNSCSNSAQVNFPVATPGAWATVTHAAIFDASSGGNMLYHGPLTSAKSVAAGEQLIFPIGTILASED